MKFFILPLLLVLATPAQAITWKEFWEPFTREEPVRYYRRVECSVIITDRIWIPGYYRGPWDYVEGHYELRDVIRRVPC